MAELYRNPYDFVPFEMSPRRNFYGHNQHNVTYGITGVIACQLSVLTPLHVGTGQRTEDARRAIFHPAMLKGTPYIPASALKGMVRSIIETVTDSCMSALSEKYPGIGKVAARVPTGYTPCRDVQHLCLTCALFGMVETREGEDKVALAGRVWLSDACLVEPAKVILQEEVLPGRLNRRENNIAPIGSPKPAHEAFYFTDGRCLGRKFYYRTTRWAETLGKYRSIYKRLLGGNYRTIVLEAIPVNTKFSFSVRFQNLTTEELDALLYGLHLEAAMCHHLGYGKPFGLGSVQVEIQSIQRLRLASAAAGPALYLRYDIEQAWQPLDRAATPEQVWRSTDAAQQARARLADILRWPRDEIFFYPELTWFREPGHSQVTLGEYQQGEREPTSKTREVDTGGKPGSGKRLRGRVESFDRGWGFIRADSGEKVFVRFTEIQGTGYRTLEVGDAVEFEARIEARGPRAYDVAVVRKGGRGR
jgi:CRISPR/Cas system CSM-associated protein Csm3 (group 7 of RAMP superfamily)/cold shock CspA family protein